MILMLGGNSNAWWHMCAGRYGASKVGMLTAPDYFRPVHTSEWLSFACDNGKFAVWSAGKTWDEALFWKMLESVKRLGRRPRFVVVRDEVGNGEATLRLWHEFEPRLKAYGWPLAMAMQDGMTPKDCLGDVAFIGGTTAWKWRNAERFCRELPRVHIARVELANLDKLAICQRWGAESVDSTGAFRDGSESWRLRKIERFLAGQLEKELIEV